MKPALDESQLLYAANRREWRAWLKQNYRTQKEVWLVYFKVHSATTGIDYVESVEEALCFGWIDSSIRRIDEVRHARRFSPRKPKSTYSDDNKKVLKELIAKGLVAEDVVAALGDG